MPEVLAPGRSRKLCAAFIFSATALLGTAPRLSAQLLLPPETGKLPSFEVAAIKPARPYNPDTSLDSTTNRITIGHYTLKHLIMYAYDAKTKLQVIGGPDWIDSRYFDITAKMDDDQVIRMRGLSGQENSRQMRLMMQSLLDERFHLRLIRETRTLPVFDLVQENGGTKLTPAAKPDAHGLSISNGHLRATAVSMDSFAAHLSSEPETGGRVVLNKTTLEGFYDFKMNWTPESLASSPNANASDPGLFTALGEQLGLKLKPQKGPVQVLVVQSAQLPETD